MTLKETARHYTRLADEAQKKGRRRRKGHKDFLEHLQRLAKERRDG